MGLDLSAISVNTAELKAKDESELDPQEFAILDAEVARIRAKSGKMVYDPETDTERYMPQTKEEIKKVILWFRSRRATAFKIAPPKKPAKARGPTKAQLKKQADAEAAAKAVELLNNL